MDTSSDRPLSEQVNGGEYCETGKDGQGRNVGLECSCHALYLKIAKLEQERDRLACRCIVMREVIRKATDAANAGNSEEGWGMLYAELDKGRR